MMSVNAIGIRTPAAKTLNRAQHDHLRQILRQCTGRREDQEQNGIGQEIDANRERLGKPAAKRNHDDFCDQIGRRDPAAVINAGADRALNIRQ